ncbi:MAG: agmatinase, partial [Planctomycetota bacterium]
MTDMHHPRNFLGLDPEFTNHDRAKVVVLPIPYEATCSYGIGTSKGPAAIIEASNQVELWDEELDRETYRIGISTLDPVLPAKNSPQGQVARVRAAAAPLLEQGKFILGLGGEHTVSLGLIQALTDRHPKFSILQVDAHLDLRNQYEGTAFSHASVMRRVSEQGLKIVCCGARAFDREEWEFAREADVTVFLGREIRTSTDFIPAAVAALTGPVYVTIDLDGLDPQCCPSTGTPEPGGMGYYQLLAL